MDKISQLVLRGEKAWDRGDYCGLQQCLQQLISLVGIQSLGKFSDREKLLDWAVFLLEAGDFQQRWEIAKIFGRLGEIAIPRLLVLLADEEAEEELRWYGVRILGELKSPQAIAPLIELLQTSEDEDLQLMATNALAQIGESAIPAIAQLLASPATRLQAVRCLSYIHHHQIIDYLLPLIQDEDAFVRLTVIEALGSFQEPRVITALLEALTDPVVTVRKEAVTALGYRPDLRDSHHLCQHLQPRLFDLNLDVCCAAAIALGRMGCDTANQYLYNVFQSDHTPKRLQLEIIRSLSWSGIISGVRYLEKIIHNSCEITLCQEIITCLGRISHPSLQIKATEILQEMLQKPHPSIHNTEIRWAIAFSLGQLAQTSAIDAVTKLLEDQEEIVRIHAIAALKRLAPKIASQN